MRGRVIGILLMAIFGMMLPGSLLIGAVSEHIGAPATVFGQGVTGLIVALLFTNFLNKRRKNAASKYPAVDKAQGIINQHHA
jgi:hypothetical protein